MGMFPQNTFSNRSKRKNGFNRRKISLLRKAAELSTIANKEVSLVMISECKQINQFSTEPFESFLKRFIEFDGTVKILKVKEIEGKPAVISETYKKIKPENKDEPICMTKMGEKEVIN